MNNDITTVLHKCATNDVNGNPRRVWVGVNQFGHILRVEDEGYAGRPDWVREASDRGVWDVHIEVTVKDYRETLKAGRRIDAARAASA
jgi:hypothetical protein